jgi:hypothetical protein
MLKLTREQIEEDIHKAKVVSSTRYKNTPKNKTIDCRTIIHQVNLCRKISLIDDILNSRQLRSSVDENDELILLKQQSLEKLKSLSVGDVFIYEEEEDIKSYNEKEGALRSLITANIENSSTADDEERY